MNENSLYELPKGWIWARLEELVLSPKNDIVDGPFGSNLKASEYEDKGIPIIRLQNVTRNKFIKKNIRFIKPEKAELLKRHSFSKNDILITKLGAPLGEACLVPEDFEWGIIVADIVRVKTDDKYISKKYLVYCINSEVVIEQFELNTKGTTRPRVNLNHIRELKLPISPLSEQYRIVTKIEELFTRLDVGVEVLKKIEAQLILYRRFVLKSACEGKLVPTEAELAKAEGRIYEPADVLLKRILTERREKRENKHKEAKSTKFWTPVTLDTSSLSELPEGWCWSRVGEVTETIGKVSPREEPEAEFIYLDISSIDNQNLKIVEPKKYFGKDAPSRARQRVKVGDVLFSTVRTYLKNIAQVPIIYDGQIASTGFSILRPSTGINELFLFYYVQTEQFLDALTDIQRGTSYPAVRDSDVRDQFIPIPPLAEQRRIVEEIEHHLSVADEVKTIVEKSLRQAEGLRQSILQKAFEGELVPQDSNDEPASVLLARIKEERAKNKDLTLKRVKIKKEGQQMGKNMEHEIGVETQVRLYDILQQSQKSLTPNQLWESSRLDIEEFYAQLKMEVQSGRILEKRPNDTDVFLEAAK